MEHQSAQLVSNGSFHPFKSIRSALSTSVIVFLGIFFVFMLNMKTSFTTDAIPNFLMINSLRTDGDLALDEYRYELIIRGIPNVVVGAADNHLIAKTPPFAAITAYPFFVIVDDLIRSIYDVHPGAISEYYQYVGKITASLFVSMAGAFMFVLLFRMTDSRIWALFGAAIYVFGTPLYSIDGQALWQHPMSVLLITVSLLLLYSLLFGDDRSRRTRIMLVGLLLGAAVGVRFNNVIPFVIIALFMTVRFRGLIAYFILGALPTIAFNMYYNQKYLHNFFSIGYGDPGQVATFMDASPFRAFFGLFFSTNFGLFVFYPILVFTIAGFVLFMSGRRTRTDSSFYHLMTAIFVCNVAFISTYRWYTGGYSWPSRMLSETIPFMIIFFVPILERLRRKPFPLFIAIVPIFAITLFFNFLGAYANDYSYHQKYYTTIDGWIWDSGKNFLGHYLRKGDLYFTRFEKGKSGQLRIRTKKYDIFSGKSSTTDEPMRTIDTCSKFDSFEMETFDLDSEYLSLSRSTEGAEIVPNATIDGVNRSVAALDADLSNGDILYSGIVKRPIDTLLLSIDGKSTSSGSLKVEVAKNGDSVFSKDEPVLSFGKGDIRQIDIDLAAGDRIDIAISFAAKKDVDRGPALDSVGFCTAFDSYISI